MYVKFEFEHAFYKNINYFRYWFHNFDCIDNVWFKCESSLSMVMEWIVNCGIKKIGIVQGQISVDLIEFIFFFNQLD